MHPFNVVTEDLGEGNVLDIIDIDEIDSDLRSYIDDKFVRICEGHSTGTTQSVKRRLIEFLDRKGSNLEMGAIAEFLVHLYLNRIGFEPQFLFFNLEENSIKKGFDGYYFSENEQWIVESKSGTISTSGISHSRKVKESYDDLERKLAGHGTNNPWRNAYNHANQIDVQAHPNVRASILAFSDYYQDNVFQNIADFNIIPGSTIFLDGNWIVTPVQEIIDEVLALITTFEFRRIRIICITKKSIQVFRDYLNS